MIVKPIPTKYRNVLFRSKLEARWAEFLDRLKIKWNYEVEGYDLGNGERYLPDFFLHEQNSFLEVKGPMTPGLMKIYAMYEGTRKEEEPEDDDGKDIETLLEKMPPISHNLFIVGKPDGCFEILGACASELVECTECNRYYFANGCAPYPPCIFCDRPQYDSYNEETNSYSKDKPITHLGENKHPLWPDYRA